MSTSVSARLDSPQGLTESYALIQDFEGDLAACGRAPDTIRNYISWLKLFQDWLGTDLRSAGRDEFRKYIAYLRARGAAQATLRSRMSAISTFYIFLEDEGHIEFNHAPAVMRKYLKTYKGHVQAETRQYITVEQASLLIRGIMPARDKAIAALAATSGLRVSELVALDFQDIDIECLTLSVHPHPKRTNCTVFFPREVADCIENYLRSGELHRVRSSSPRGVDWASEESRILSRKRPRRSVYMIQKGLFQPGSHHIVSGIASRPGSMRLV
jgi:site-specific recombinase XerD